MQDDQTIFQKTQTDTPANPLPKEQEAVNNPQQNYVQSPPLQAPVQRPAAVSQNYPSSAPQSKPPLVDDNPISNSGGGRLAFSGGILKILIGLVVVIILFAVIFFVVLPIFNKPQSNGQTSLTYWGLWEDSKTMQPIIDDFERQNPNITVKYSKQDIKQYRETLATRINNGKGPDIFTFHNSWYPMLSSFLLPFPTNVIGKEEFSSAFYPVAREDLIKNGAIYGVPVEIDTLSMYVNKDLLSSVGIDAPKTWNDFVDDARSLTVKDENGKIQTAGAAMGTYANITHASDILSLLFLQNGADLNNVSNSSDKISGALNFYTSFSTDSNNVWDSSLDDSILAFSKGNLAMYFGYSWDYFTIKSYNPNFNFEIVPVPQLVDQNVNMASYWAAGVSVKSVHQKEALQFVKYLSEKSTEENMYLQQSKERAFGEPYARVDLGQSLKDNPLISATISQAATARSSYFVDGTWDSGLNQQADTYLENAVNAINSNTSVGTAFDTFSQGISQVLQKYGVR